MASESNLLEMSESDFNVLKKIDLVKKAMNLKNKVGVADKIKSLCANITELTETISQVVAEISRLSSDLVILKL